MKNTFVRRFENFDSQPFDSCELSSSNSFNRERSSEAIEEDKKQSLDISMSLKSNNGEVQKNRMPNIYTNSPKEGRIVPNSIILEESSETESDASSFRNIGIRPKILPAPHVDSSE